MGLSGFDDWGVHAPGVSEGCAEGALTGAFDWGGFAASPHLDCDEGGVSGGDDWGDYAVTPLPDLGDGALTGADDWGLYAPVALPDLGEGAFTGWDDWGQYAAQEGSNLAAADLELAARRNWIFSRYIGGKLWLYDDFEATALKWDPATVGAGSTVALSTVAAASGSQSCALTTTAVFPGYAQIVRDCVRSPVKKEGFGLFFAASAIGGGLAFGVDAYIDEVWQEAQIVWRMDTGNVYYIDSSQSEAQIGTVSPLPVGVQSHNFVQLVVDWENITTVRFRVNDDVIPVNQVHYSAAAPGEVDRMEVVIRSFNQGAAAAVLYVDDFVYTYDEPVA